MYKSKLFFCAAALLSLAFFMGCTFTTALGVLDVSVPEAELSHLEINDGIRVITFNNQPVEWRATGFATRATISIPSGHHSLMVAWVERREIRPEPTHGPAYENITHTSII